MQWRVRAGVWYSGRRLRGDWNHLLSGRRNELPPIVTPDLFVDLIRQGDPEAERAMVVYFRPRVVLYFRSRTGDPELAQDLGHEVLLAMLCALRDGRVRSAENLAPYIFGVARNVLNEHLRKRSREKTEPLDPAAQIPWPEPDHAYLERHRLVHRAIEAMGDDDRQVLLMTLVDGRQPAEIGEALSLSAEVVRQRKSRALKKLTERVHFLSRMGVPKQPSDMRDESGKEE
jgi:RNA polymerase sigma factor (sigma-70 family)